MRDFVIMILTSGCAFVLVCGAAILALCLKLNADCEVLLRDSDENLLRTVDRIKRAS